MDFKVGDTILYEQKAGYNKVLNPVGIVYGEIKELSLLASFPPPFEGHCGSDLMSGRYDLWYCDVDGTLQKLIKIKEKENS